MRTIAGGLLLASLACSGSGPAPRPGEASPSPSPVEASPPEPTPLPDRDAWPGEYERVALRNGQWQVVPKAPLTLRTNYASTDNRGCSLNLGEARWEGDDLFVSNASKPQASELHLRWVDLANDVAEVEACWTRGFYSRRPSRRDATACATKPCIDPEWYRYTGDFRAESDARSWDGPRWCPPSPTDLRLYDDRIELGECGITLEDVQLHHGNGAFTWVEATGRRADGTAGRVKILKHRYEELAVWACGRWSFFSYDEGQPDEAPCVEPPSSASFDLTLAGIAGRYEPIVSVDSAWKYANDCGGYAQYDSWETGPVGGAVILSDKGMTHARSSFPIERIEVRGDTLLGWYQPGFDDGEEMHKLTFQWIDQTLPIAEINGQRYTRSTTVLERDPTPCP